MGYARYLRLAGSCSILLGVVLTVLALPGLFVHYAAGWAGLLFVPAVLLLLGGSASRRGIPWGAPGRWLAERPLRASRPGRSTVPVSTLERQVLGETATWIVASGVWIFFFHSNAILFFGGGLASIAYGAVQLFGAAPWVEAQERRRQTRFRIHRRLYFRAPDLTA